MPLFLYHTFGIFFKPILKASFIFFYILNSTFFIQKKNMYISDVCNLYISIVWMLLCTECYGNQSQWERPILPVNTSHSYYKHFTYPDTSLPNPAGALPSVVWFLHNLQ